MFRRLSSFLGIALFLGTVVFSPPARAATTIKLGTLVPVGTSYHKILMRMGENWKKDSGGTVELRIYAGGKAGGESEMVGLSMQNNLQGAMLTAVGLSDIEPGVTAIQYLPMEFRTLDEVDYVMQRLRPMLDERLAKKGFVVLFWTDGGWVRIFSKSPVSTPDDLKKLKLFAWAGDNEQVNLMRSAGFNPVPVETADIVPNLQTGLLESVPMPPFFALASQVDTRAPYMLAVNWAALVGACVVRRETWETIPPEIRVKLLATAAQAGVELTATAHRESDESVAAMQKRGLKVTVATEDIQKKWRGFAESVYPKIRGHMIPVDVFDETLKLIAEYRAAHAP
jgi:TRAP-type C4-dicarboxylate transport system substrate-binding protein